MSENIKHIHMHQSGPIPGFVGWFSGGQTITINTDTMEVVDQAPLAQRAYNASPLVEMPTQEESPAQSEPTPEPVVSEPIAEAPTPELVQSEPAPIEAVPEPAQEQGEQHEI